jgi:platelet-activating factor acetylhydrolase
MLWGGLKPIRRRFLIDVGTLSALTYSVLIPPALFAFAHKGILITSCLITYFTAGLTKRWTVSFPMIPIILLQLSRYTLDLSSPSWTAFAIQNISLLLLANSFILTILFPAVNISRPNGKHNVGIIDVHLPIDNFEHDHVTVKLLYPTKEKSGRVPYFDEETSKRICKALMKVGAPPPLNKLGFMLDQWRLSTVHGKRNAIPHVPDAMENSTKGKAERSKLPIVVYSHGLTGTAEIYSYQNMSLAANGTLVMSITHSDASAIGVKRKDGSFIDYDPLISQLAKKKDSFIESVQRRRGQVDYRARELLAAVDALIQLNQTNNVEEIGVSFVDKLDLNDIIVMGHSFGGATSITAANMRPHLFTSCIAHDPAVDWCTDGELFVARYFLYSSNEYEYVPSFTLIVMLTSVASK